MIFFAISAFYLFVVFLLGRHFLFLFMLWFGHFGMALSSAYLESGFYITEQQRFAFNNGATLGLLALEFFLWFGVWSAIKISPFCCRQVPAVRYSRLGSSFALFLVGMVLFLLILNVLLTGSPLFDADLNRFNFWDSSKLSFLNSLFGDVATPLLVILGVIFAVSWVESERRRALIALMMFFVFLGYYFLIGHKFSMQLLAVSLFFPPYFFLKKLQDGRYGFKFGHLLFMVFCISLLFFFIGQNYIERHAEFVDAQGGVVNAILYRFWGLQGHVWWGGYNEFLTSPRLVENPFEKILDGMHTMMYVVSPAQLVDNYLSAGVRFTMAYPAVILYVLGAVGAAVFLFFSGLILGGMVVLSEQQLLARRLFGAMASLMILSSLVVVLNMGEFRDLISIKFLLPVVALLYLTAISNAFSFKRAYL